MPGGFILKNSFSLVKSCLLTCFCCLFANCCVCSFAMYLRAAVFCPYSTHNSLSFVCLLSFAFVIAVVVAVVVVAVDS